jgi:uncharacterized C2H2 Zn-finger protein
LLETEAEITTVNLELQPLTDRGGKAWGHYRCSVCGLVFAVEQDLVDHIWERHTEACSSGPVPNLLNLLL